MDKLKVFISDDSATIRKRLVTVALDLPEIAVVGQAQDVPGSLAAIRQTRPDAVILDIRMPGGNGIEVLREVKKLDPAPKVIMFTNYAHAQYREFDKLPQALEQVRQGLRADAGAGGQSQSHDALVDSTLAGRTSQGSLSNVKRESHDRSRRREGCSRGRREESQEEQGGVIAPAEWHGRRPAADSLSLCPADTVVGAAQPNGRKQSG
jgi:two-component system LytT family response regulator